MEVALMSHQFMLLETFFLHTKATLIALYLRRFRARMIWLVVLFFLSRRYDFTTYIATNLKLFEASWLDFFMHDIVMWLEMDRMNLHKTDRALNKPIWTRVLSLHMLMQLVIRHKFPTNLAWRHHSMFFLFMGF